MALASIAAFLRKRSHWLDYLRGAGQAFDPIPSIDLIEPPFDGYGSYLIDPSTSDDVSARKPPP